jgi:hypothetical protein
MLAQFSFLITKCKLQETQYLVQHIMSTTLDQSLQVKYDVVKNIESVKVLWVWR